MRCVGVVMPQSEIMIVDDEGKGVRTVVHRFAMGYWKNPEAREATFGGGRLKTGDTGVINEDGFVWIVDLAYS